MYCFTILSSSLGLTSVVIHSFSAWKRQLRPFATSCAKDYKGHSLLKPASLNCPIGYRRETILRYNHHLLKLLHGLANFRSSPHSAPKGRPRERLMLAPCLEYQGCHLIALSYFPSFFFCLVLLLFLPCYFSARSRKLSNIFRQSIVMTSKVAHFIRR